MFILEDIYVACILQTASSVPGSRSTRCATSRTLFTTLRSTPTRPLLSHSTRPTCCPGKKVKSYSTDWNSLTNWLFAQADPFLWFFHSLAISLGPGWAVRYAVICSYQVLFAWVRNYFASCLLVCLNAHTFQSTKQLLSRPYSYHQGNPNPLRAI